MPLKNSLSGRPQSLSCPEYFIKMDPIRNRDISEGDIAASYSGDTIMQGKVRKPFRFEDELMVTVTLNAMGRIEQAYAYHLVPVKSCPGNPTTYREKLTGYREPEKAWQDPLGSYHGILVTWGKEQFVMCGPEVALVADHQEAARPEPKDGLLSLQHEGERSPNSG